MIHCLDQREPSGFRRAMHLVELGDGKLLVHSPTWLGDDTFARVAAIGTPTLLLAPNHHHHMSVPRFQAQHPGATIIASSSAIPRLWRKGLADAISVASVKSRLPSHVRILEIDGIKNGEVWVVVDTTTGRELIVCDSFFNLPGPLTGVEGFGLKMLGVGPGLRVGRTFRVVGIADKLRYRTWVERTLAEVAPTRVHFSHGDPLEGPDAVKHLNEALHAAL
jgi:hypothetical protein